MSKVHYVDHCPASTGQQVAMLNHNSQRGGELVSLIMASVPLRQSKLALSIPRAQPQHIVVAVAIFSIDEWQYKETFGKDYDPQEWENTELSVGEG